MEKRKAPRLPTSILIDVNEAGTAVSKHRGHVSDLSVTGMALDTPLTREMTTGYLLVCLSYLNLHLSSLQCR